MTLTRSTMRQALADGRTLWIPGAYDVLSARLIEQAGFDGVLVSGFGVAASLLGQPDVGLYTMSENLCVVRNVCAAVSVPVMADLDTGYGNAINVMRSVREFEAAGAASVSLEDQVSPKQCPLAGPGGNVIALEEAVGKIRAAVAARRDPELLIIARTDANDAADALARCRAYAAAGADVIKPSSVLSSFEDLRMVRAITGKHLSISVLQRPPAGYEQLGGIATFPLLPVLTAAEALRQNLAAVARSRAAVELPVPSMAEADFFARVDLQGIRQAEERFLPASQS
jgi:methylisocitrate lyase